MTKEKSRTFRIWDFGFASPFDIRLPRRSPAEAGASNFRVEGAFTLIELLVVISIIIVLAGLVLATSGYVAMKGRRSRAEAEIAAVSAALESYKADNGIYPRDTINNTTDNLDARTNVNPSVSPFPNVYQQASRFLYGELSGDRDFNGVIDTAEQTNKTYFTFKPQMLDVTKDASGNITAVNFLRDPFGNSYGYSTAYQHDIDAGTPPAHGYNPTFDLWSNADPTPTPTVAPTPTPQDRWIKNW